MPYVNQGDDADQMLPAADVIEFDLEDGCKILVRPSGTEPKIKAYLFAQAQTRDDAQAALDQLETAAREILA